MKLNTKVLLLALIYITTFTYAQLNPEEIAELSSKNSFIINNRANSSLGTGFLLKNGWIVTNRHVVEGASPSDITINPIANKNIILGTEKLIISDAHDLAIIKQLGANENKGLTIDTTSPKIGSAVFVIGNSQGLSGTFSNGMISGIRESENKNIWLQMTAPISQGNSGGPVLNADGEVIGVSTLTSNFGQNLNFAVPIKYVHELCLLNSISNELMSSDTKDKSKSTSAFDIPWIYIIIGIVSIISLFLTWYFYNEIVNLLFYGINFFKNSFKKNFEFTFALFVTLMLFFSVIIYQSINYFNEEPDLSADQIEKEQVPSEDLNYLNALEIINKIDDSISLELENQLYIKAYPFFLKSAEAGNADAMDWLGSIFSLGSGLNVDYKKAEDWYKQGVAKNHLGCIKNYAYLNCFNENYTKDLNMGVLLYKKAVSLNDTMSIYYLSCIYAREDLLYNPDSAILYINKAIENGYFDAYYFEAEFYRKGVFYKKDLNQAFKSYKKASYYNPKYELYLSKLGDCYANGWGVDKNSDSSRYYYEKSGVYNSKVKSQSKVRIKTILVDDDF